MVCRFFFLLVGGGVTKLPLTVGLIYRFFVIILLAVTITWIPIIQTIHSERLFEYMQAVRSYLVPPISATFVLAIFCKRVTEQVGGCWHGHHMAQCKGLPSHCR